MLSIGRTEKLFASAADRIGTSASVRQRARRRGSPGIHGNGGILESVSYRIQKVWQSPNPTLSAKKPWGLFRTDG